MEVFLMPKKKGGIKAIELVGISPHTRMLHCYFFFYKSISKKNTLKIKP